MTQGKLAISSSLNHSGKSKTQRLKHQEGQAAAAEFCLYFLLILFGGGFDYREGQDGK